MKTINKDLQSITEHFPSDFTENEKAAAKTLFLKKLSLLTHEFYGGKLQTVPKCGIYGFNWFNVWYTPGVSAVSTGIRDNHDSSFMLSNRGNLVAVVSDSTRVLGDGDCSPSGGLGVMEGKCMLMKYLGGVDAYPICVDSLNPEDIIKTVQLIQDGFGGINLEDIKAPECFDIERELQKSLSIPVFHDDQHGTAIVVVSALINAFKLIKKSFDNVKVVVNGAGAAGMAITHLLQSMNTEHIILCDRMGAIYSGRAEDMNSYKQEIAEITNSEREKGSLSDVIKGADVFIGVSTAGCLTQEMARTMNKDAVVLAMANPLPEIMPDDAKAAGVRMICTGRSDFPNQVNNLLAFPGIFRGALDVRASCINLEMKISDKRTILSIFRIFYYFINSFFHNYIIFYRSFKVF